MHSTSTTTGIKDLTLMRPNGRQISSRFCNTPLCVCEAALFWMRKKNPKQTKERCTCSFCQVADRSFHRGVNYELGKTPLTAGTPSLQPSKSSSLCHKVTPPPPPIIHAAALINPPIAVCAHTIWKEPWPLINNTGQHWSSITSDIIDLTGGAARGLCPPPALQSACDVLITSGYSIEASLLVIHLSGCNFLYCL